MNDLRFPDQMHYIENFENALLFRNDKENMKKAFGRFSFNSKSHYQFRKKCEKLNTKEFHTLVPWSVVENDVNLMRERNISPDENGVIVVKSGGETRTYKQHTTQKGRLFPLEGDSMIRLPGAKAHKICTEFLNQVEERDLMKFVNQRLNRKNEPTVHSEATHSIVPLRV